MYSWINIHETVLPKRGHERFVYNTKNEVKLLGMLCSPDTELSITANNETKILLRNHSFDTGKDCRPNGRPLFMQRNIDSDILSGVLKKPDKEGIANLFLITQ